MELVKNIATVVGCITACFSLLTLVCKPIRKKLIDFIKRSSNQSEVETQLNEIKSLLEEQAVENKEFRAKMEESMEITLEFTEKQCRNIIKDIFEKHKASKVLPLADKKTLMDIEELYIRKMHKNHWGKTLLDEMSTWEVDSTAFDIQNIED